MILHIFSMNQNLVDIWFSVMHICKKHLKSQGLYIEYRKN